MAKTVAFIGSVGVPNIYGGFEMFLEACTPIFSKKLNVIVTCDKNKYADRRAEWNEVHRVFVPVSANGLMSPIHDLLAFFAVFFRADFIVVLGVSAGIFFPIFRLFCFFTKKRLFVNVDGLEFRRDKFGLFKRAFLYISDRFAQYFSHQVIIDNEGLREFLIGRARVDASLIPYPGDHVIRSIHAENKNQNSKLKLLTICRIEPENQCHLLLGAFSDFGDGEYVFIGNWADSIYGGELRRRYGNTPGLKMLDPIYDPVKLAELRSGCDYYLHGHSVGGTNPSLVEMLFYDCEIIVYDCIFNRFTAGSSVSYFSTAADIVDALRSRVSADLSGRYLARQTYKAERIVEQYISAIERVS